MKTAQILASKDEFLPAAWTARLSALWDAMPPRPWRVVRAALQAELRRCPEGAASPEAVFAALEESCLAAASVAQVHAATLRRDPPWAKPAGASDATSSARDVVIKVQVRKPTPLFSMRMRQPPSPLISTRLTSAHSSPSCHVSTAALRG